jgi:hypothetical protein
VSLGENKKEISISNNVKAKMAKAYNNNLSVSSMVFEEEYRRKAKGTMKTRKP